MTVPRVRSAGKLSSLGESAAARRWASPKASDARCGLVAPFKSFMQSRAESARLGSDALSWLTLTPSLERRPARPPITERAALLVGMSG